MARAYPDDGARYRIAGGYAGARSRQLDAFEPTPNVTIDLTDVGFVDSSGIGCLFKLCQRVTDADGVLVATGASPPLRSLMESTGLNRVIAILP